MTPKEKRELAKKAAEQHKMKKVLMKRAEGDKPAEFDFVPVKTVHVTIPNNACYLDLNEEEIENLKNHSVDKSYSIEVFEFAEEAKKKEAKK